MTKEKLERKSETEGLTAEEVTEYRKLVKPVGTFTADTGR